MAGLRPFRTIPKDIIEWTKWMRAQDSLFDVAETTETSTTTITEIAENRWVIKDFDDSYELIAADDGLLMRSTSATAVNLTVPSGVFETGTQVTVLQYGAGQVTVVAGAGTTIRTPTNLTINEQYGTVTLILFDRDEWVIAGRMTP